MKTLYLMRHGQTAFNQRKLIQGWCDSPLTALGIQQAMAAKTYFSEQGIQFDAAFSSTSERASDTLEIITSQAYQRVKALKEWYFGKYEGASEELNPPLPYGDFFVFSGGEGEQEFRERINNGISQLMAAVAGSTVLMVSHGGACRQFMRKWAHTSQVDQKEKLKNCCILKFYYEKGTFELVDIINPVVH